jgi:DNA-binding beta-propeller fold protein YncE
LGTFNVGVSPLGIAFDGAHIWVANRGDGTVTKLRASDGVVLGTFTVPVEPYGVAFDGENIWVTGALAVTELKASNGNVLGQFYCVQCVSNASTGVAFDGANIWVSWLNANMIGKL